MDRQHVRRFRPDLGARRPPEDVWPLTVPAVSRADLELTASRRQLLSEPESFLRHLS